MPRVGSRKSSNKSSTKDHTSTVKETVQSSSVTTGSTTTSGGEKDISHRPLLICEDDLTRPVTYLSILQRRFDITDLSFIHALLIVVGGSLIVLKEAPTYHFWTWAENYFKQPTSPLLSALFTTSVLYFIYDTYFILLRASRRKTGFSLDLEDVGYLFHHGICIMGLIAPVLTGLDGPIIIVGFITGEVSNPPRFLAEHLGYELLDIRRLVKAKVIPSTKVPPSIVSRTFHNVLIWQTTAAFLHLTSFIALRAVLLHYTYLMWWRCELLMSQLATVLLLIFSIASIVHLILERRNKPSIPTDPFSA